METVVRSATKEVTISPERPTVIIGERINPTGKKLLAESLLKKDMGRVRSLALSQIEAGAAILDVNVGAAGVNEVELLPMAIRTVMEATDVPLCLDSANAEALRAALQVYKGKALINSVNGEEASLARVLPLVKEFGAAVIGLAMDESGIPCDAAARLAIARKIVTRAEVMGILRENVLIDCLALSVCADSTAAKVTLGTIRAVREELGVNMTLGASNVSFGLPDREAINDAFLAMALAAGVNAPIVNPTSSRKAILISDLLLGRDEFGMNYMTYFREQERKA
jgi:5-methyltetrahydrofolate--homocysteine methyltransferase